MVRHSGGSCQGIWQLCGSQLNSSSSGWWVCKAHGPTVSLANRPPSSKPLAASVVLRDWPSEDKSLAGACSSLLLEFHWLLTVLHCPWVLLLGTQSGFIQGRCFCSRCGIMGLQAFWKAEPMGVQVMCSYGCGFPANSTSRKPPRLCDLSVFWRSPRSGVPWPSPGPGLAWEQVRMDSWVARLLCLAGTISRLLWPSWRSLWRQGRVALGSMELSKWLGQARVGSGLRAQLQTFWSTWMAPPGVVQCVTCVAVHGCLVQGSGLWISISKPGPRPLETLRKAVRSGGERWRSVGRVDSL